MKKRTCTRAHHACLGLLRARWLLFRVDLLRDVMGFILGLYGDIGIMEKKMETAGLIGFIW